MKLNNNEKLTFEELSQFKNINNNIINDNYLTNWDWEYLINNTDIIFEKNSSPIDIIDKYPDRFIWAKMHYNPNITKEFILKHSDKNWGVEKICTIKYNNNLLEFIPKFNKDFIEFDNLNKDIINYYYKDDWNWEHLLTNTNIIFEKNLCPLYLIDKYPDRFNWQYMHKNTNIDENFIIKNNDKNWDLIKLIYRMNIFINFFKKNKIKQIKISSNIEDIFETMSRFKFIDKNVINEYYEHSWDWEYLLENTNIIFEFNSCPLELIEKYPDRFDWFSMYCNTEISSNKYLKNILENKYIMYNNYCSLELIEKYPDKFNWEYMIYNRYVDKNFILKHLDKNWNIEKLIERNEDLDIL